MTIEEINKLADNKDSLSSDEKKNLMNEILKNEASRNILKNGLLASGMDYKQFLEMFPEEIPQDWEIF